MRADIAPLAQSDSEGLLRPGSLPVFFAPVGVGAVQFLRRNACGGIGLCPVIEKTGECVHFLAVAICRLGHLLRRIQPVLLPGQAAFDGPAKDTG